MQEEARTPSGSRTNGVTEAASGPAAGSTPAHACLGAASGPPSRIRTPARAVGGPDDCHPHGQEPLTASLPRRTARRTSDAS